MDGVEGVYGVYGVNGVEGEDDRMHEAGWEQTKRRRRVWGSEGARRAEAPVQGCVHGVASVLQRVAACCSVV